MLSLLAAAIEDPFNQIVVAVVGGVSVALGVYYIAWFLWATRGPGTWWQDEHGKIHRSEDERKRHG